MSAKLAAFSLLLLTSCGGDPEPSDAGRPDAGARDAGPDAGGCVASSDPCGAGDTCCGDLVCQGTEDRTFCVAADDTCFVGADVGCCLDGADCESGESCVGAVCRLMGDGVCKAPPPDGFCWSDADCGGAPCTGAVICGCSETCMGEDVLGTCP